MNRESVRRWTVGGDVGGGGVNVNGVNANGVDGFFVTVMDWRTVQGVTPTHPMTAGIFRI